VNAYYVVALVVLATLIVTWGLGRIVKRLRERFNVVGNLVARVGFGVAFLLAAAGAATDGGLSFVAVPFLVLLAVWNFVLTAGVVWVWRREGLEGSD
jgi:hypothetical protein